MLWLYALADALDGVEGAIGVRGEAPIVIASPSCAIVAGWIDQRPPIDRDALTRQDALVREVHARARAVLPIRFGTSVRDAEAAKQAVEALQAAVRERLDVVRDREQMTLRARASGASRASGALGTSGASGEGVGRRYLEELASRRMPPAVQPLVEALRPWSRALRIESGGMSGVVTIYQLIDRGASTAYLDAANRAARALSPVTVRISGPSPAYAFADIGRLP